jgi:hypothetical protein
MANSLPTRFFLRFFRFGGGGEGGAAAARFSSALGRKSIRYLSKITTVPNLQPRSLGFRTTMKFPIGSSTLS